MKKALLLFTALILVHTLHAQDTSFEAEEGYELDEISGQKGWSAFSFLSDMFTVSDENSSDGDYALRLGIDQSGFIPGGGTAGATRDISQDVPDSPDSYQISADVFITSAEEGEIDFNVYGAGGTESLAGATIALLDGRVLIIENTDFSVGADFEVATETFFHLSMIIDFENDETLYYVDDELVYTGDLHLTEITGYGFLTTGKAVGFVDNITTTDTPLSVPEISQNNFSHYISGNQLHLESPAVMEGVNIYNLNGQEVLSETLNSTEGFLQLENLSEGVYITRLVFEGYSKTFKFIYTK